MQSLDGVDRMFLSGTRATFTMEDGAKPDEATVRKAVERNRLKFVSLTSKETKRAAAAWVAKTPGLT